MRDGQNDVGVRGAQAGSVCEVALAFFASIPSSGTEQLANFVGGKFVELVDRAQHREPASGILLAAETDRFERPVEDLAVVDLHHIAAAGNAERFHGIRRHHAHLGIGGRRRRADGVGVELHELAEATRTRLLVAEYPPETIGTIGLRQRVKVFRDIARQRRGQIVAQANPLLVVVLEREHAFVGPVLVGQEFAERVGEFHRRGFHRLKTVALIDFADFLDHLPRRRDRGGTAILQPARQARLQLLGFLGFVGHGRRCNLCRVGKAASGAALTGKNRVGSFRSAHPSHLAHRAGFDQNVLPGV